MRTATSTATRRFTWIGCGLSLTPAIGCAPQGNTTVAALAKQNGGLPPGVNAAQPSVDGLVVGDRLMAAGQYELALDAYYRAAVQHGLTAEVLAGIGSADLKLGRLQEAESILKQAIKKDPTYVAAFNNLGCVMMEKDNYGPAKYYFQQAYALDGGKSDVIRQNLKLAIARAANSVYTGPKQTEPQYNLVQSGPSEYQLQSTQ